MTLDSMQRPERSPPPASGPFLPQPTIRPRAYGGPSSEEPLVILRYGRPIQPATSRLGATDLLKQAASDAWLQQREDLRDSITEYGMLQRDWAAPGDVPPTPAAVDEALSFLYSIPRNRVLPHVAPAGDGEIVFDWRHEELSLDVGFFGDGQIYYCVKASRNTPAESHEEPFEGKMPEPLLALIPGL